MATALSSPAAPEWLNLPKNLPAGALLRLLTPPKGIPAGAMLRELPANGGQRSAKTTGKVLSHPAGKVTAIDEETGLPIVRRDAGHTPDLGTYADLYVPKNSRAGRGEKPSGTTAEAAQRPVEQGSNDAAAIRNSAKLQQPVLEAMAGAVVSAVPGAKLEGSRVKSAESQQTKTERGKPPETNIDNLGARISANSRSALERLREHIETRLPVERKEKIDSNGLNMDQYAVRTGGAGAANQVSEIQVGTKAQVEALKQTEPLYEKQKKAEARGDTAEASRLSAEITAVHKEATRDRFRAAAAHKNEVKTHKNETKPPAGETKYKFGNTQANIPDGSDAAEALDTFRDKIPDEHLAGDGKDVGDVGNHVTVRYGIRGDNTDGIRKFIEAQKTFTARLGKTDVFSPTPYSNGAAVVHAQVQSPELERMNDGIQKHGDFEPSSFDSYKPHATIAYIDPQRAEEYKGRGEMEGSEFPVDTISIIDRNGGQTDVRMKGGSDALQEPGASDARRNQGSVSFGSGASQIALKPGEVVKFADGRAGVVRYFNPANGQPARARVRLADGKIANNVRPEELTRVTVPEVDSESSWYGSDLDGTLAEYHGFEGLEKIGDPIGVDNPDSALSTVKRWIAEGKDVRILSAKISDDPKGEGRSAIEAWTQQFIGKALPVTDRKDAKMVKLLDDRAVQAQENTGKLIGGLKALRDAGAAHRQGEKGR
ncbi:MAG TPA: 2'-5' RNA ligase family protein [Terracidiphilus sp.]|nr:2'-5' RNA ligase family protein [Terracidiphilus sp.]